MQKEEEKKDTIHWETGLTEEQVQERIQNNLVNKDTSVPTKSIKTIIASNIFT